MGSSPKAKSEPTAEALQGEWFHTGDVAVIGENEYPRIVDRKKDIIVSGGEGSLPGTVTETS